MSHEQRVKTEHLIRINITAPVGLRSNTYIDGYLMKLIAGAIASVALLATPVNAQYVNRETCINGNPQAVYLDSGYCVVGTFIATVTAEGYLIMQHFEGQEGVISQIATVQNSEGVEILKVGLFKANGLDMPVMYITGDEVMLNAFSYNLETGERVLLNYLEDVVNQNRR